MRLKLSDCKGTNGKFFQFAESGAGILYYDNEGNTLCANCANKKGTSTEVKAADLYEEGPAVECDDCHDGIESGCGNPEDDREEGEKIEFFGLGGQPGIRIPADSYPLRRDRKDPRKTVWPWNGGEYLLTYEDKLIGKYYERAIALAYMRHLTGLCEECSRPLWKDRPCDHTQPAPEPPAHERKEMFVSPKIKGLTLARLERQGATIEYAYIPPYPAWGEPDGQVKISYIVITP